MLDKLKIVFSLILLVACFLFPLAVHSQNAEPNFDAAFESYTQSKELYDSAHEDYVFARAQYLRFRTLKSRTDARDATLRMLEARDDVVITYLEALSTRLGGAMGLTPERKSNLFVKLTTEKDWFTEHKAGLSSAATPEDLADDSDEAKARFDQIVPLFYETLATTAFGKTTDMRDRVRQLNTQLRQKVDELKLEERDDYKFSSDKLLRLDRWLFESENRLVRVDDKLNESEVLISQINSNQRFNIATYNNSLTRLEEGRGYMNEALSFLKEVIKDVKTEED